MRTIREVWTTGPRITDLASNLRILRVVVPEGRNDRSQAIYCLECVTQRTRPVGNGMIRSTGRFLTMGGEYVV